VGRKGGKVWKEGPEKRNGEGWLKRVARKKGDLTRGKRNRRDGGDKGKGV